ncbi:hypothetical protein ACWEK5_24250 [Rhodococcus koreensis]
MRPLTVAGVPSIGSACVSDVADLIVGVAVVLIVVVCTVSVTRFQRRRQLE